MDVFNRMGCSSSRHDRDVLPETIIRSGNTPAPLSRSSRRFANMVLTQGMTPPPTSENSGDTTVTLSTDISNATAEIFIIRGGIFIVTGNRVIALTMNPNQQLHLQQQQVRDTSDYISSRVRTNSIHQFYLESMELRHLQENLLRLGHLFDEYILHDERINTMIDSRPPPTSQRILGSLPSTSVTEQDLLVQQNKDCCICCADYVIGEIVIRLPCGHIFHHQCVHEWLGTRNTCPLCRWELETDDLLFEQGRIERMKSRNPAIITAVSDSS